MSKEKFDPSKIYGDLPAREVKTGDRVKNEALYPGHVWDVKGVTVNEEPDEDGVTRGMIAVACPKGQGVFSAPFKWTHADGAAIVMPKPPTV